jgi:hypothetical protein
LLAGGVAPDQLVVKQPVDFLDKHAAEVSGDQLLVKGKLMFEARE